MKVAGTAEALAVELTDSDAAELAELAQGGNRAARDRLAHSLMGLALKIAGAYTRRSQWTVDEVELQGVALETLLRYGIDRYNADSHIPVRVWAALTIRRRLASVVERSQLEAEARARYAVEYGTAEPVQPEGPAAHTELHRLLRWAEAEEVLTPLQASVLALRGTGMLFDAIGQRLGVHRRKASREYAAALVALEGKL